VRAPETDPSLNQVVRSIDAGDPCPPASWQWLADMAAHMDDDHRGPHAAYSFLLDVSILLPTIDRVTHEGDAVDALAALPGLLLRLGDVDAPGVPFHLLDRFHTQTYIRNICRTVRARLHSAVVRLVDCAARAPVPARLVELLRAQRAASVQVVHDMVGEILGSIAVVDPDRGSLQLSTLCWGDTLKHLWCVFHVAKLGTVSGDQSELVQELLLQVCRVVGIEDAFTKAEAGRRTTEFLSNYSSRPAADLPLITGDVEQNACGDG